MLHSGLPAPMIPLSAHSAQFEVAKASKPAPASAAPASGGQVFPLKPRKQYTIQRKREKWTKEEHRKFMEAIEKFGRNWKKVEELVQTKTRKQIRSHAQKHFDKLKKMGMNFPPPRAKKRAIHPYPSRKTNELLAMYTKSIQYQQLANNSQSQAQQQQQFTLQLQTIKKEADQADPHYERIFSFLTSLFNPSKYPNQHELISPLSFVDRKYLRLLMHNLAVVLSREQMQDGSQTVPTTLPVQTVTLASVQPMPASLQEEILLLHQPPTPQVVYPGYPMYGGMYDMANPFGHNFGMPLQPYMADIPVFDENGDDDDDDDFDGEGDFDGELDGDEDEVSDEESASSEAHRFMTQELLNETVVM